MPVISQMNDPIFVFGSNTAGIHGKGAARTALLHHGAVRGQGSGIQGRSYAIPTKHGIKIEDGRGAVRETLPLPTIRGHVNDFLRFALLMPSLDFQVTRIGCGLAGLKDEDIAPMFSNVDLGNLYFDTAWSKYLGNLYKYWGTF